MSSFCGVSVSLELAEQHVVGNLLRDEKSL